MARVAIDDALKPGTLLSGKIRVVRVVGQGSMGIVLEAIDQPLQRRVAVKLMTPERAADDEARRRFLREARAAVRLASEHITRLIDVGELDDGTPYLVMEYLVGLTLADVLLREGPPPIDVVMDWVLQALDGIAEAHRAGFVHRDLKPENLFLAERPGRPPIVKVLDFGTVKDLGTKGAKLTRTGSTIGSPAYMPPEQVRAEAIDARADVWAMGVTLYELTTGRLPFGGESVLMTLASILREEPAPVRALRADAPAELEALISCALSKDPAKRYASATELLAALSLIRAKLPTATRNTRTVRLGQHLGISRPDFSDTPEPQRISEIDSSQVRSRVPLETVPELPPEPPPKRSPTRLRGYMLPLVVASIGALLMLLALVITLRRHASTVTPAVPPAEVAPK